MLAGNHTYEACDEDGTKKTVTQLLAERLDAPVLGICAAIRLGLQWGARTGRHNYDIWAYHGKGGGTLAGSTFNAIERWANGLEADLVIMGHDHKKGAVPKERLRIAGRQDTLRVTDRTLWIGRTGSFLKGYEPGKASYVAGAAMNPVTLGTIDFELSLHSHECENGKENEQIVTELHV
jgi:hypothetical protein